MSENTARTTDPIWDSRNDSETQSASDTPRTDALVDKSPTASFWWPDFARQLERELNAQRTAREADTYVCSKCGLRAHISEEPCPLCRARAALERAEALIKSAGCVGYGTAVTLAIEKQQQRAEQAEKERDKWEEGCRVNCDALKESLRTSDNQRLEILSLKQQLSDEQFARTDITRRYHDECAALAQKLKTATALIESAWREGLMRGHGNDNYFPDEWWPRSRASLALDKLKDQI